MTETRKLRVFLCHSSQDKPTVRELYRRLNAEGWIDPWLDEEKLLPGQDWDMEIKEAVQTADLVVVCLSSGSILKEGYIQKEMRFALDVADEKPEGMIFVIPLRLDDCPAPKRLAHWHWMDYFPESRQKWAYDRLLNSLSIKANMVGIHIDATRENTFRDVRFRELLDADIVGMSATGNLRDVLDQIAETTKRILKARFVYVSILSSHSNLGNTACAGVAPKTINYLTNSQNGKRLIQSFSNSTHATRVYDICTLDSEIDLDNINLRNLIAVPLRMHRLSIGSIFAFGKEEDTSFSEDDEILSSYISIQACAAIEGAWLSQELRDTLKTTSIMFQLSTQLTHSEALSDVGSKLAKAAQQVSNADSGGVIFLGAHKEIEFQVEFDANGIHFDKQHPVDLINKAMESRQDIIISTDQQPEFCFPIQSAYRQYGALWLKFSAERESSAFNMTNIKILINFATQAVERHILLMETQLKTKQLNK